MRKWNVLGLLTGLLGIIIIIIACQFSIFKNCIWIVIAIIFALTFALGMFCFWKYEKEINNEKEKSKKERLQILRERYADYVSLVNEIRSERIDDKKLEACEFSISEDYLVAYEKYLSWICSNRIEGRPDTFIQAACLMYSLIKKTILPMCVKDDFEINELGITMNQFISSINYEIAFEVALKLISEPSTYYKDEHGKWIEQKHPKVNIIVPDGLIKNSSLYHRILNTIAKDFEAGMDYYVMQLSNLLHLIYLNCKQ